MGKKLTTIEFIEKTKKVHGDKYNYSLVDYKNNNTKVKIICQKHDVFEQTPSSHMMGRGCPICYGTPLENNLDYINKCNKIHKNKYDYSLAEYKGRHEKIKIICPEHGIFEQESGSHLRGNGCPKCAGLAKYNNESFIKKCNILHNYKYDYSLINYVNKKQKIKIICPEHGIFEQTPNDHLAGSGCSICSNKFRYNKDTFIKKSIEIHGKKYDYSLVEYKNNKTKVKLICPTHGIFEVRPDNHINSKNGCPVCSESLGEKQISILLNNLNINYQREKKFENCRNIYTIPFDFYLPEHNICIEYDGLQHFKTIEHFGGIKTLEKQKLRDNIKNKFCKENNINLIRIKYDENIDEKLSFLKNKPRKGSESISG